MKNSGILEKGLAVINAELPHSTDLTFSNLGFILMGDMIYSGSI